MYRVITGQDTELMRLLNMRTTFPNSKYCRYLMTKILRNNAKIIIRKLRYKNSKIVRSQWKTRYVSAQHLNKSSDFLFLSFFSDRPHSASGPVSISFESKLKISLCIFSFNLKALTFEQCSRILSMVLTVKVPSTTLNF